ncbi:hypothetical protein [Clostridium botulinum]|uniref:hypothetical protein n=1 Tax=Clostridium botulinum TaxID=1491 RepID=UPI0015C377D8|nr:hypothetical protein [Clostridium botulinum]
MSSLGNKLIITLNKIVILNIVVNLLKRHMNCDNFVIAVIFSAQNVINVDIL